MWVGSGMEEIDGLDVGDPVTAEQMRALFGAAASVGRVAAPAAGSATSLEGTSRTSTRLGAPFKIMDDATPFRVEVATRIAALNGLIGEPVDASVAAADRARIRTQVAREFFVAEHGRAPIDAAELAGQIAEEAHVHGRRQWPVSTCDVLAGEVGVDAVGGRRTGGGGGDRTGPSGRGQQRAELHRETCPVHPTRPQGIRQVNVRGLVAAAFTHRDSPGW